MIETHIDEFGEVISGPFFRSGYNYDREAASAAAGLLCLEPTLTQQSFADEVDINTIVRRFGLTGQLPENVRAPSFGDFEDVSDYHTAMNAVLSAQASFQALPGHIRYDMFNNDPGRFVDFCSDPANLPKLRELGLAIPEKVSTPAAASPPEPIRKGKPAAEADEKTI